MTTTTTLAAPATALELAAVRLIATANEYREHVMGVCFPCSRNLRCPIEKVLGDANDAAAHAFALVREGRAR